jgi:ABC-type sulfate/molybdate transport systems ATPase subunit
MPRFIYWMIRCQVFENFQFCNIFCYKARFSFLFCAFLAVDAHVGQHLFEECIMHLQRKGKCVVLVTNALQFLKHSAHILVLKDGRVSEQGKYDQLLRAGRGFSDMITTMQESSSKNTTELEEKVDGAVNDFEEQSILDKDSSEVSRSRSESTASASGAPKRLRTSSASSTNGGKTQEGEADSTVSLKKSATLITAEDRETGDVNIQVYGKWAMAAGGLSVGMIAF